MTAGGFIRLFVRQFGLTLATLCLMLQAAVPSGFMIASSDSGFPLSIVICGAQSPILAAASAAASSADGHHGGHHGDPHGDHHADHQVGHHAQHGADHANHPEDERPSQECAFAGFAAGALAAEDVRLAQVPVRWAVVEVPQPAFRGPSTHTAAAPPPSRAPPSVV